MNSEIHNLSIFGHGSNRIELKDIDATYCSVDLGFDLRNHNDMFIRMPDKTSLRIAYNPINSSEVIIASGKRTELETKLKEAGYKIFDDKKC